MEFWGVEVKSGESFQVVPGKGMLVHISQIALGKNESNGKESIRIYLKNGDQKLIIGTLSHEKFPQLSTEIVFEKDFELSHSSKNGSVYFTGYKVDSSEPGDEDDDMSDDEAAPAAVPAPARAGGVRQVNFQLPSEDVKANRDEIASDNDSSDDDSSDDDSSSEDDETEEVKVVPAEGDNAEDGSSDDDEDDSSDSEEDDSSDEETPKKAEEPKKRSAEASTSNNAVSNKKAKFVTPQKTESKKPHVHVATPHPSKGGKSSGSNGEASKTPKSAGAFGCKTCNRSFTSEMGLQSHTKAKHSAAA